MAGRFVTVSLPDDGTAKAGKTASGKRRRGGRFRTYVAMPEGRGPAPGLVLLQEIFGINDHIRALADRYAEEGYIVYAPDLFWRIKPGIALGNSEEDFRQALDYYDRFDVERAMGDIAATVAALRANPRCAGKVGAIGFCLGGLLAYLTAARVKVDAAVCYYGVGIERRLGEAKTIKCPVALHFAGEDRFVAPAAVARIRKEFAKRPEIAVHDYPGAHHAFANDTRPSYHKPSAWMAHSRSIALLRRTLGPNYDLEKLWDQHTYQEFAARDVPATMATMVAEPYVNHVPTMTGGVGGKDLARFYGDHFIPRCPKDTKLVPVSRTVGADRVVDEMLFCFTHDIEIDWMLPGVAPTGRYVEVPLVAIVNFRGPKLYHEHIYWDQASVLVQIGVLDPTNLPVTGIEQAKKLLDETRPSNKLMTRWRPGVR